MYHINNKYVGIQFMTTNINIEILRHQQNKIPSLKIKI